MTAYSMNCNVQTHPETKSEPTTHHCLFVRLFLAAKTNPILDWPHRFVSCLRRFAWQNPANSTRRASVPKPPAQPSLLGSLILCFSVLTIAMSSACLIWQCRLLLLLTADMPLPWLSHRLTSRRSPTLLLLPRAERTLSGHIMCTPLCSSCRIYRLLTQIEGCFPAAGPPSRLVRVACSLAMLCIMAGYHQDAVPGAASAYWAQRRDHKVTIIGINCGL